MQFAIPVGYDEEHIAAHTATIGQRVCVWTCEGALRGCGQGGTVTENDGEHLTIKSPVADYTYPLADFRSGKLGLVVKVAVPATACIEFSDECQGEVQPFSPNGRGSQPMRCQFHIDRRMERYEDSIERYADSASPPDWFDPSYAGESWDED